MYGMRVEVRASPGGTGAGGLATGPRNHSTDSTELHSPELHSPELHSTAPTHWGEEPGMVDTKLEVVVIPVSDVDHAKAFYGSLGWRLDADFPFDNGVRIVQFTPPGSDCSIQFGAKLTSAAPGSAQGLYLVVYDL
jgi:hypothetical protein